MDVDEFPSGFELSKLINEQNSMMAEDGNGDCFFKTPIPVGQQCFKTPHPQRNARDSRRARSRRKRQQWERMHGG